MASTYSTSLRIQLIATGEQPGVWGNTTNTNLGTLIEQAITGYRAISVAGLTTYTLSSLNGVSDEARNAVLNFTGSLSADCTVVAPAVNKIYIVKNSTSGDKNIIMSVGSGTTVSIPSGYTFIIYCDASNFYLVGNESGNFINLTTTGTVSFTGTGAVTLPAGTTAQEPSPPSTGMVRFNTTTNTFEGYSSSSWGPLGGGASGSGVVYENKKILTSNYTMASGSNGESVGPITINSGVTVTIPSGSRWVIL